MYLTIANYYSKLRYYYCSRNWALLLLSAIFLMPVGQATAQIGLDGINLDDQYAVCASASGIFVPQDDDCEAPLIGTGDDVFVINALTIGPAGSQARFDAGTGAATFSGSTTFTGSINASNNVIQNVGTPVNGGDAANKAYVDGQNGLQDTRLTNIETVNTQQDNRLTGVETVNTQQNTRLTGVETVNAQQDIRLTGVETVNVEQDGRLFTLEGTVAAQGEEIDQINGRIGLLRDRDRELASGIAISMALDQPNLLAGQDFAMRVGWGNFDGSNAMGVSAAGLLSENVFGPGSTMILDLGVGASTVEEKFGAKAGVTFGW